MAVIKSQFSLRLNLTDHAKIKKIAEAENRSMTNMIEALVKQRIQQYKQENGEISLADEDLFEEKLRTGRILISVGLSLFFSIGSYYSCIHILA